MSDNEGMRRRTLLRMSAIAAAATAAPAGLGGFLRQGTNTIEVEVATTLRNRLRVADPDVFGGVGRQDYGLVGPVRLVPYGQAVIR